MTVSKYKKIERRINSFPSIPATVAQVLSVVENSESSLQDLIKAILPDQSM